MLVCMLCCAGVQELTQDTFKAPRGVRVRGYGHMFQDSTAHSTRLTAYKDSSCSPNGRTCSHNCHLTYRLCAGQQQQW